MVTQSTLSALGMTNIEQYFDYIIDSKINGNHKQARSLYADLSDGMQGQRADFFIWAGQVLYEAKESDEVCEISELKKYLNK